MNFSLFFIFLQWKSCFTGFFVTNYYEIKFSNIRTLLKFFHFAKSTLDTSIYLCYFFIYYNTKTVLEVCKCTNKFLLK